MTDQIKVSEVSAILRQQLEGISTGIRTEEVGTVLQVSDGVARIYGLDNAEANELLQFDNGMEAIVMNLEEDNVGAVLLGPTDQVKEGDIVKKGDLLFELEDTTYRAKEQAAKAKVDQIKAELEYAKINYDRQSGLYKTNAVAKNAFDEADKLYKTTKAQLAEAEATWLDARNDLSYTKVYAPISGRIGKVTYTQGNYVTPSSEKLADIVQVDPIYASFAISERDFRSMFDSDVATMKKTADIRLVLADDTLYPSQGTVAFIDNKIDRRRGYEKSFELLCVIGTLETFWSYWRVLPAIACFLGKESDS